MSGAITQLEHVSKRFGQQLAVDDVTLDVPRERCFAWLGPNGCGKTTLIRMMLGLARPTAGSIRLRGCVVPDDIRGALSRVGGIVEVFGSSAATGSDDHGLSGRQPQPAPNRLTLAGGVGAEQHDPSGRRLDGLAGKVECHP